MAKNGNLCAGGGGDGARLANRHCVRGRRVSRRMIPGIALRLLTGLLVLGLGGAVLAPGAYAAADVMVLPRRPLNVKIPLGKPSVTKSAAIVVRNADSVDHVVAVSVDSSGCPAGMVGSPDFLPKTLDADTSILVPAGKARTAKLPLTINSSDFASFNFKAPTRCRLAFQASAIDDGGNDPTPQNNATVLEINVIDRNDAEPTTATLHETTLTSARPASVTIALYKGTAVKVIGVTVGNADYKPTADSGDAITLSAGTTCAGLTVGTPVCDALAGSDTVTVIGGKSKVCKLALTADATQIDTPNPKSPRRCLVTLTARGPNAQTTPLDPSNNSTTLVVDILDKNDLPCAKCPTKTATPSTTPTITDTPTVTGTPTLPPTITPTPTWTPDLPVMAATPRVMAATVHSIGFEWDILSGDVTHRATGTVCYRKHGEPAWLKGSLYRIDYLGWWENTTSYRPFNMLAGSLMFLDAATEYDIQLKAGAPPAECDEGPAFTVTTLPIPTRGTPTRTLHLKADDAAAQSCSFVSSNPPSGPSSCDCAANPAAAGCDPGTICDGRSENSAFVGFAQADECAGPGDLFLVHAGTYKAYEFTHSGAPGQYIAWVGDAWDAQHQQAEIRLTTSPRPGGTLKALLLAADHLWFEGLHLEPIDGLESQFGQLMAFIGGVRPPANCDTLEQCQATCQSDPNAHCDDYGTSDIVIVRNTIRNFSSAVSTGKWCDTWGGQFTPYFWFDRLRSNHWAQGSCENASDSDGLIWGNDPTHMDEDRHRADMHRHWYVADNVMTNNIGPATLELLYLTFLADSDIAYNQLALTQRRADWSTLKSKLLLPNCTLGTDANGVSLWPTHAQCDMGGGVIAEGVCKADGTLWECAAEAAEGLDAGPYCICRHAEPDAMFLTTSSSVDVYGNDVRDVPADNFIQGDFSYANIRIWRNRIINGASNAVLTQAPMLSAPWYVVRNEYVSLPGVNGATAQPFMPRIFDRMVIVNNTFVVRRAKSAQDRSDMLLRSVSRNNLWLLQFAPSCNLTGFLWNGLGDGYAGDGHWENMEGTVYSNYRTDLDYDGLDWDTLPDTNPGDVFQAHWEQCCLRGEGDASSFCSNTPPDSCSQCSQKMTTSAYGMVYWPFTTGSWNGYFWFDPPPSSGDATFQKVSRGCAGGPRDGLYCESDADCTSSADKVYNGSPGDFTAPDPNSPVHCVYGEGHYTRVHKESALDLCVQNAPALCTDTIDAYAAEEYSTERLGVAGEAVDAGDAAFFQANQFYLNDIGSDGRSIVPYVVGAPDLGAYESGQPATHYGPRSY